MSEWIEWLEKLMASLIVLVMLFIVLLLAFPDRLSNMFSSPRAENTVQQEDRDLKGPSVLPKGDVKPKEAIKPRKTVERLPDSSDNQKALYRYIYRDKPPSRDVFAERGEGYVVTRRTIYQKPEYPRYYKQRYVARRDTYEPRYSSVPEDCAYGSCLCNCSKPYWANADWYERNDCWYE